MTDMLRLVYCGDRALLVYLGDRIDPDVNRRVHALSQALREIRHPAILEVVPSYHAVLIEYDSVRLRPEQLEEQVQIAASQSLAFQHQSSGLLEIPVLYGAEEGPDLETVTAHTGLTPPEVIRRHASSTYHVYCLGFSPGFAYMGGLDPALKMPRLASPRVRVPTGSVGIGGVQTGIYPTSSPGGWHLIGRTPLPLFDPRQTPPSWLRPGMHVRFVPISAERFAALESEAARPSPSPPAYVEGKTGLRILKPGLLTTIQDLGRRGLTAEGIPVAGAIDFWSLMVGNWLLGNRARSGALEITLVGPELEFTGPVAFCLAGAPFPAELIPAGGGSPRSIPGWTALLAGPGDRLRMGEATKGCRAYLCVAGGFDLEPVLGSLSEDLFGNIGPMGRPLLAGDWLPVGLPLHPPADLAGRSLPQDAIPPLEEQSIIRVTRGPQADRFSEEALATFLGGEYIVGQQSDRQGLRLQGAAIPHSGSPDILSEPNPLGSIQVPANGQPIFLLRNCNTIGGYAKIAVAVYSDVALAGQARPGHRIAFREVDLAEAHASAWADRRRAAQVRRYLERGVSAPLSAPRTTLAAPVAPHAKAGALPPKSTAALAPAPPITPAQAAPPRARTFRITVSGVIYEALVEEIE